MGTILVGPGFSQLAPRSVVAQATLCVGPNWLKAQNKTLIPSAQECQEGQAQHGILHPCNEVFVDFD